MREGWRQVPLGDVARLDIERVPVVPTESYRIAGVLNAGRGLFERETIRGDQTNYPVLHRLRAGQLVMRKLTAWEGPITTVSLEFDGLFVSAEFPTFTLGPELFPEYMALVCERPAFWEAMRDRSAGSVQRRKRVNPAELLRIFVDVPPVAEQRRIVDLVGSAAEAVASADRLVDEVRGALRSLREATIDWTGPLVPLSDLCCIKSSLVDPTRREFAPLDHIGIERIEARTGRLLDLQSALDDGVASGKYLVAEGDVVYSKIRPELRKAAFPDRRVLCSADAYPLTPRPGVDPRFLLELLLTDRFTAATTGRSTRTKMPKPGSTEVRPRTPLMSVAARGSAPIQTLTGS